MPRCGTGKLGEWWSYSLSQGSWTKQITHKSKGKIALSESQRMWRYLPHEIELLGIIAEMCGKVELRGNQVTQGKAQEK